jgi:hypothetical protein
MLSPELHQREIPQLFARFRALLGDDAWLVPAARMDRDAHQWPYLLDILQEQFKVVLALRACTAAADANGGRLPWTHTDGAPFIETFVFVAQVLDLHAAAKKISNKRAAIFLARVREALKEPRMLQAFQLEARVATHFIIGGKTVVFPEIGSSKDRFDLLVEDLGRKGFELEAKVVTRDKGRKIHLVESRHVLSPLVNSPLISAFAAQLRRGLAVRVTVRNRLPENLEELRNSIGAQILTGQSGVRGDGTAIRLFDFDVERLGVLRQPPAPETIGYIESLTGSQNSHRAILRPTGAQGVLVVCLDSAQPDSMLHETFETFAESAGRQLTGQRAGAFMASFEGISREAMLELARDEGVNGEHSALAWRASAFLERENFPHIVGVGFFSEPNFNSAADARHGVTYWIPKRVSPHWDASLEGMFARVNGI